MSGPGAARPTPILEARDLKRHYPLRRGFVGGGGGPAIHALDGIDISVHPGETVALVGETGCGKSTAARCLALLERPDAGSSIWLDAERIDGGMRRVPRHLRRHVQMVFQDPFGSLNPRLPISAIIGEPLVIHGMRGRRERMERVGALLDAVGLAPGDANHYPHEFSGGQRQRVAIARALALEPRVVVADEPLSALDVSIQSQILNLMLDLKDARGLAYLFISHDLAVVDQIADRVAVMYLGKIVEIAGRRELFNDPRHPYTRALIAAVPVLGAGKRRRGGVPDGEPPDPVNPPGGCPYRPRCPLASPECAAARPALTAIAGAPAHRVACHYREAA